MKKQLITALILASVTGFVHAAGDAAAGKDKSAACAACHGPDGNSFNPVWPKLAGQHASYIEGQLKVLKDGTRKDPLMSGQAAALSDQDMADLAAYYTSQAAQAGTADTEKATAGMTIYEAGNKETGVAACIACHSPSGNGNPAAGFPSLKAQHAAYIEKALKDFRSGTRTSDMGGMMRGVAAKMSDAEIANVAQYITGLK
jgi:cytochrome c553